MRIFQWASKYLVPKQFDKIRVGNNEDGGYVLPRISVEQCDLCVTFGLGSNITFENDLVNRGMRVVGFDNVQHKMPEWGSVKELKEYSDFSSLPEVGKASAVMFKIDNEGSEWNLFNTIDLAHFSEKVHTFIFELHLHYNHNNVPLSAIERLMETHHIAHVHGNNYGWCLDLVPIGLEIVMVNKKWCGNPPIDTQKYPIQDLDWPNDKSLPDLKLPWIDGSVLAYNFS